MLFAIILGVILGAAGVTLLRQWALAAFEEEPVAAFSARAFPHLAPSVRRPARHAALRRRPRHGLQPRRAA